MTLLPFNPAPLPVNADDWCARCEQPILSNAAWFNDQSHCGGCALILVTQEGRRVHGSRIQGRFWDAADNAWPGLDAQDWLYEEFPVALGGRSYRADFTIHPLLPGIKIAIELDSFAHHSSSLALTRDHQRQRQFQRDGWHVIRFSGSEVWHDAAGCVDELIEMVGAMLTEAEQPALMAA